MNPSHLIKKFRTILLIIITMGMMQPTTVLFGQNGRITKERSFEVPGKKIKELNELYDGANFADTFSMAAMSEITYESSGLQVKGYLIRPNAPGTFPCLVYCRPGEKSNGILNEIDVAEELHKFARWGYMVVATQYRGYAGGDGKDQFGGEDVQDVLNLIPLLAQVPGADTSRIGIYGVNRGGMMTYLALKNSCDFDAAIVESGFSNLFLYAAEHAGEGAYDMLWELIPEYSMDRIIPLQDRSMQYWPEKLCKNTPILLLHGTSDKFNHPSESYKAYDRLFKEQHPTRLVLLEGGSNKLPEHIAEKDRLLRNWLNDYVRDKKKWPEIIKYHP
jgi:dipeptidyl aminopeptidase/acylaminoacyl peptidase